jgi:hypothetical protein
MQNKAEFDARQRTPSLQRPLPSGRGTEVTSSDTIQHWNQPFTWLSRHTGGLDKEKAASLNPEEKKIEP